MRVASLVLSACFGLVACSPRATGPVSTFASTVAPSTVAPSSTSTVALDPTPLSRKWMLVAQEIVKAGKFSPPASARLYAYAAVAYQEVIRTRGGTSAQAGRAVHDVLVAVAPGSRALLDQRDRKSVG